MRLKRLYQKPVVNNLLFWGAMVFLPLVWAYTPDFFRRNEMPDFLEYVWLRRGMASLSWVVLFALFLLLTFLTRRIAVSGLILSVLTMGLGVANYYKIFYRRSAVTPLDISQVKDAFIVARDDISISLTGEMILMIVLFVLAVVVLLPVRMPRFFRQGSRARRYGANAAVLAASTALCALMLTVMQDAGFMSACGYTDTADTARNSYYNTFYTNFFHNLQHLYEKPPQAYSQERMQEIGDKVRSVVQGETPPPDVILVVAESWQTLQNYGVEFSQDPFENYRLLSQEGAAGMVFSPYYSGGTANVEFELLTGLPSNMTNNSSTIFNASLYPDFPSLCNYYRENGYTTIAFHSHTNLLYNRLSAYRYLGFEELYFSDSIKDPQYNGLYVSDACCIDKAIELYDTAAASAAPVFLHVLTMEGHTEYNADRLEDAQRVITVSGNDALTQEQRTLLSVAATCYAETDAAVRALAEHLRTVDRDVLLIVVGDHQTRMEGGGQQTDILDDLGISSSADFLDLRTTPYLVWANYDCDLPQTFGTLTHNMLLPNALRAAGAARPAYFDYLLDSMDALNGVDGSYAVGTDGRLCDTLTPEQHAQAEERELVRYDLLSGKHWLRDSLY